MDKIAIHLQSVSKKYYQHYLYRNLNLDILAGDKVVITGSNGSGKSTLLKIVAGLVTPSSGKVIFKKNENEIDKQQWFQYISVAAPYMGLIDDFSVTEIIDHVSIFRKFLVDKKELLEMLELNVHLNKPFKYFSSGMKQKTKLILAIADAAPVLLLDEPCSNLDANAIKWYERMITQFAMNKTVVVFSNSQTQEYFFCNKHFDLSHQ